MNAEKTPAINQALALELPESGIQIKTLIENAQKTTRDIIKPKAFLQRDELIRLEQDNNLLFLPHLNFGDLNDPANVCSLTLYSFSQTPPEKSGLIPVEYKRQLLFPGTMATNLLSIIKPGEMVSIEGAGSYNVYSRALSNDSRVLADRALNYNSNQEVEIKLLLSYSEDQRKASLLFSAGEISGSINFEKDILGRHHLTS